MIRAQHPPETVPVLAREAERDGFEELWLAEDCFLSGGPTLAVAALAATGRLRVGIGLLPAAVRNPAIVAMELATIARLHPGRLSVAFGHGIEAWMRQIGARPQDRIVALAETVAAVRTLLAGEEVSGAGLEAVQLDFPPPTVPPVLVGSTGPRGLAVASDGILLPEGAGPAAVRWARAQADPGQTVVYAWLSIAGDEATALAALRPDVEAWAASGHYPRLAELAGIEPGAPVGDDAIRAMAVAGDPAGCAAAVAAFRDAGADSLVLLPPLDEHAQQLRRFAAEVMPITVPG
jgi:alkanesulfonate monooxygenase SsuD/methylene tetrahydromethanopterin reductase-like flavin-dependent oxidoreductase (luciferase family)